MKKNKLFVIIAPLMFLVLTACSDYVNDVQPVIDRAQDDLLNTQSQVPFLAKGVQQRFATFGSYHIMTLDLLSDQLIYTSQIPTASFPSFEDIDKGTPLPDNADVQSNYSGVGQVRKYADDLVRRCGIITFTDDAIKNNALFVGNFYGALSRFYMAISFGLTQNQPGGTIDAGPFIPRDDLLNQAVGLYNESIKYQTDAAQIRIVNSFIAKAYLAKADYANAATYAAKGMIKNDKDFVILYNDVYNNSFWGFAGAGRVQIGVNSRFNDYIKADAKEANRIKLGTVTGKDKLTYYYQLKYPDKTTSLPIMTWQENNLMIAECASRGSGSGNALTLVNDVRTSHSLDPLTAVTTDIILVERDKELFCQGNRAMDQNRIDKWHLTGTWRYFPIPRNERNGNPNIPML